MDPEWLVKSFYNKRERTLLGINADIWKIVWDHVDRRGGRHTVRVIHINSHLPIQHACLGVVPMEAWCLNSRADALANFAAKFSEVSKTDRDKIKFWRTRTYLIQKRLVAANKLWMSTYPRAPHEARPRTPKPIKPTVGEAVNLLRFKSSRTGAPTPCTIPIT